MSIFNLVLFWIFFGFWSSYVAKNKGRNPRVWFCLGLALGLIAVVILYLLPRPQIRRVVRRPKIEIMAPIKPKNPSLDKVWFYLDQSQKQQGPFYFEALLTCFKQNQFHSNSYLWSEGMEGWKRLNELPELYQELNH